MSLSTARHAKWLQMEYGICIETSSVWKSVYKQIRKVWGEKHTQLENSILEKPWQKRTRHLVIRYPRGGEGWKQEEGELQCWAGSLFWFSLEALLIRWYWPHWWTVFLVASLCKGHQRNNFVSFRWF